MTTTISAHRGAYLLYLNGYAVPCPSITVNAGVGQIPEASFALAPHPSLQRLGCDDRIDVVVFYLDDVITPGAREWRLLFEGEIVGWSYSNTPLGTKMNFSAIADIAIFKQLQYAFMTANDIMGQAIKPAGDVNTATQPGAFYPFSLFKKGLLYGVNGDETITPDITKPFEILYNAVRGMMDTNLNKQDFKNGRKLNTPPATPLINFFSRWARKRNFQNRFAALPSFEDISDKAAGVFPIMASIQDDTALQTLASSVASQIGDQGSMWDVLQFVFTKVYFELVMLPTAPAYRVRLSDGKIQGLHKTVPIGPTEEFKNPMRLVNYFVKPQMYFGTPPMCNVVFPSMVRSLEYSENYMSQPTRSYVSDGLITSMLNDNMFVGAALTVGFPETVNAVLREKLSGVPAADRKAKTSQILNSGKNVLVYPEEFFKGPIVQQIQAPSWFTILMSKQAANKKNASTVENQKAPVVNLQDLFDVYVRYSHYKTRYESRGGMATLSWNPYIVPGFPCFIFDRRAAAMDVTGYVQSVTWSMNTAGMHTSISFGYARTIQEFIQTQYEDSVRFNKVMSAAPAEPLPTVRDIIQDPAEAEGFYRALFYGRSQFGPGETAQSAAALLPELVGAKTPSGVGSIQIQGNRDANNVKHISMPGAPKNSDGSVNFNMSLVPIPSMVETFNDHEFAMRLVARPICTMAEYIRFRTGTDPDVPVDSDPDHSIGAPYWKRIYKLRQGPAQTVPEAAMTGATEKVPSSSGQKGEATAYNDTRAAVPTTFPQTRLDWDEVIEAYVEVLNQSPPLT